MAELLEMIRIETINNVVEYILVADIVSLKVRGKSDAFGPTVIRTVDGKEFCVKVSIRYIVTEIGWVVRDLNPKILPVENDYIAPEESL